MKELALKNRILEIKSGSWLYGTNTPQSDLDYIGIFMPTEELVLGLNSTKEIDCSIISKLENGKNTTDAVDRKFYEIRQFVKLALQNNPNVLEMLFPAEDCIVYVNDIGRELLNHAHMFPHKGLFERFTGYAYSQKHKMVVKGEHTEGLLKAGKLIKDYASKMRIEELYDLTKDTDKQFVYLVKQEDRFDKPTPHQLYKIGDLQFPQGVLLDYVNDKLLVRLNGLTNRVDLYLKYAYDCKFASHLIRLLLEGKELLETGKLTFPLKERKLLLDIKEGKYKIEEVLEMSEKLEAECAAAKAASSLPHHPNSGEVEKLTISILKKHLGY